YDRYGNRNFDTNNTTTLGSCSQMQCNPTVDVSNNRFTTGQGYTYDLAGNVISDAEGRVFTYDGENKQTLVKDVNNVTVGEYYYDGDGKRVKKYIFSTQETTIFVYDASGKMVAEYSTTVAPASEAKVSYLTSDHLGSPRILTDANGNVISRRDFHPFGEEIYTAQRIAGLGYTADNVRQKFATYERDDETQLDFAQARYYSKNLGRFYSVDPVGPNFNNPQTLNKYRYALNNPLRYFDKDGEYEEDVHRDLTRTLAYAAGFSMEEATTIANADQYVDDNPETKPDRIFPISKGIQQRRDYHFTDEERRDELWEGFALYATFAKAAEDTSKDFWDPSGEKRTKALTNLGVYFHAQQDSFSHAGFEAVYGHMNAGHAPDKTFNNVNKANAMARDTFDRLAKAGSLMGGTTQPLNFNGDIQKAVNRFNAAKTLEEKRTILKGIESYTTLVRRQRELRERDARPLTTDGQLSTNIVYR
ncbi:MAG: DUF6765 family protein, partial [Pyrinomonadaceae bacterium]